MPRAALLLGWVISALTAIAPISGCDGTHGADPASGGSAVEAGQGGGGNDGAAGRAGQGGASDSDHPTPRLLSASPADGSADVYPFPLPHGVSISLTFSVVMATEATEVNLHADGGTEKVVPITWADSGTEATVLIAANPITGAPPLLDTTSYALDLSVLTSDHGVPLDKGHNLTDGALRFTTGAFDALLNHACGHVQLGPFDGAAAAAMPGPLTVSTDVGHVNYTIALPETDAGFEGYVRVATLVGQKYHFLFDRELPVALVDANATEEELVVEAAPAACDGITHRAGFTAQADEERFLHLGPIDASALHMIVEIVRDG